MTKATIGARFGAFLLDSIFVGIISSILIWIEPSFYYVSSGLVFFLYSALTEGSSMSATLGKKICGIMVVDKSGNRLSMGEGFLRAFGKIISSLIFGIGYIIALFRSDGAALHDLIAGTHVVVAERNSIPVPQQVNAYSVPNQPYQQAATVSQPRLICTKGFFAGRMFMLPGGGLLIGTDATTCSISFPAGTPGISRNHCKVMFNPASKTFVVYDIGSTYGTFTFMGQRIQQGQPAALMPGSEFYLSTPDNSFRVEL